VGDVIGAVKTPKFQACNGYAQKKVLQVRRKTRILLAWIEDAWFSTRALVAIPPSFLRRAATIRAALFSRRVALRQGYRNVPQTPRKFLVLAKC